MPRAGSFEQLVTDRAAELEDVAPRKSPDWLDVAYADAAEAREELNRHMGRLQRLQQANMREGYEHERETDPILRPDGQC